MSGGHWDYSNFNLKDILDEIGNDSELRKRFPDLASGILNISEALDNVIHDLDWDLSGDTIIKNDKEFEKENVKKLKESFGKSGIDKRKLKEKLNKEAKPLGPDDPPDDIDEWSHLAGVDYD